MLGRTSFYVRMIVKNFLSLFVRILLGVFGTDPHIFRPVMEQVSNDDQDGHDSLSESGEADGKYFMHFFLS